MKNLLPIGIAALSVLSDVDCFWSAAEQLSNDI